MMKLREIREKHDLNRPQAAAIIGRSARTVQDWELEPKKQDPVITDYLLLILGDLSAEDARQRALDRMREKCGT